mmetsp:Transcript_97526/g.246051  ORF Transcript_97526/g.246051 Transcript_97526/m.246051 type:complete len:216 (+) Transcript_97526:451-1098(+)
MQYRSLQVRLLFRPMGRLHPMQPDVWWLQGSDTRKERAGEWWQGLPIERDDGGPRQVWPRVLNYARGNDYIDHSDDAGFDDARCDDARCDDTSFGDTSCDGSSSTYSRCGSRARCASLQASVDLQGPTPGLEGHLWQRVPGIREQTPVHKGGSEGNRLVEYLWPPLLRRCGEGWLQGNPVVLCLRRGPPVLDTLQVIRMPFGGIQLQLGILSGRE